MDNWDITNLSAVTSILGDGLHGTPIYDEDGEYYFINGNNLVNGRIEVSNKDKKVSKPEFEKYKKTLNDRTILVSINGTLGNVAFYNNEKIVLGKSACYFNLLDSVDKYYVRYVLESDLFKKYINTFATGSIIKNISLKQMRDFEFRLPPLHIQKKLSYVLSTLDEKIALNNQINATLEQMAKTLYDYWFVQFDFPDDNGKPYKSSGGEMVYNEILKREIPKGWDITSLDEFAKVKKGILITEKTANTQGKIKVVSAGVDYSYFHDKSNYPENTITISASGANAGFINFWREPIFACDCTTVIADSVGKTLYVLNFLRQVQSFIYQQARGSAQPHVYPKDLEVLNLVKPCENLLKSFDEKVKDLNEKISVNLKENQQLVELRDWLLPMLMNGQVTVQ